jgi:hypothetical protein
MKRLMTLLLALSFLTVTVAPAFAQDTAKKTTPKKGKKKGGKKTTPETPKKDGGS